MKTQRILVSIYGHPENYPPTLSAIACLAQEYTIKVIYRAHQSSNWIYPAGVEIIPDGPVLPARAQEQLPIWRKIGLFIRFCWLFRQTLRNWKPDVVLLYDNLSVLAYYIATRFLGCKPVLWYHNHDVCDPAIVRKYSLTWWSLRAEKWIFPKLSIFSLPAIDRKTFFPMDSLGGRFFFLPNYPAISFYKSHFILNKEIKEIRILFQGQLGIGHGIEELIEMMPLSINGLPVKLILRGHARNGYDKWLHQQIEEHNLQAYIEFHGFTPYKNIPALGAQCHIGLAVFKKQDVMNRTISTASNKIYEYAALGLPILYFDNAYFRTHLGKYSWAKATDLSTDSIRRNLEEITWHYPELAATANEDFKTTLNFECYFSPLTDYLEQLH